MSNIYQIQPIQPIQSMNYMNIILPTNQPNMNLIALTFVIEHINPNLYRRTMLAFGTNELLHFINISRFNYNYDELLRIIDILDNAFSYILIRDMIIDALNNNQNSFTQLNYIHPNLFNIIQTINDDQHGHIFLTNILDNM